MTIEQNDKLLRNWNLFTVGKELLYFFNFDLQQFKFDFKKSSLI